jgi:hypothetical protein
VFFAYLDYKGPDFTAAARQRLVAELNNAGLKQKIRLLLRGGDRPPSVLRVVG